VPYTDGEDFVHCYFADTENAGERIDIQFYEVSAKTGQGIKQLFEEIS